MNSNGVYYEHVSDDYWFGVQGGHRLLIDRSNGYFNATKLCKDHSKHLYHWSKNKNSQELVSLLRMQGIADNITRSAVSAGKDKEVGGRSVKGTYVPKELILNIALWISPQCYIHCSNIVQDFVLYGVRHDASVQVDMPDDSTGDESVPTPTADPISEATPSPLIEINAISE